MQGLNDLFQASFKPSEIIQRLIFSSLEVPRLDTWEKISRRCFEKSHRHEPKMRMSSVSLHLSQLLTPGTPCSHLHLISQMMQLPHHLPSHSQRRRMHRNWIRMGLFSSSLCSWLIFPSSEYKSKSESAFFFCACMCVCLCSNAEVPETTQKNWKIRTKLKDMIIVMSRRGLSKYFQGESQSFSSLSDARCIEDLAKKETPYKKMKPCKSYAGNLDAGHKPCHTPGPCNKTIAKKTSRGSCSSLVNRRSTSSLLSISKPPPIPVNKNL
ncbi:uncharacterized protein LOC103718019 isoform X1 [Phoenix dactylifera]|uniref:Uncharacterized protein LOC103718019 isoform X1 n=1 Tax=Phoenix dactylifera TaxID=42345 RepID=A0A8B7MW43_PHODC|nr:uncharacterized protein LOC103718019 isoform X1 [Phoenix dactylifera]